MAKSNYASFGKRMRPGQRAAANTGFVEQEKLRLRGRKREKAAAVQEAEDWIAQVRARKSST